MSENEIVLHLITQVVDPWTLLVVFAMSGTPTVSPVEFAPDVITRIVNVHWGGGLAVEFFDGANGAEEETL